MQKRKKKKLSKKKVSNIMLVIMEKFGQKKHIDF